MIPQLIMKIQKKTCTKHSGRSSLYKSLNSRRKILLASIELSTNVNLTIPSNSYFRMVDDLIKNNGMSYAVTRLKNIHHCARNCLLGLPNPEISFLATRRDFPKCLKGLRYYGRTPQGIQAVLSLTGYYRSLIDPKAVPDFSSITAEPTTQDPGLELEISRLAKILVPKPLELGVPKFKFRAKSGPNGHSTKAACLDLTAIERDVTLCDALLEWLEKTGGEDMYDDMVELLDHCDKDKPSIHSRISLKFEGGGKVRPFAIADYFTQCSLLSLHKRVASVLRKLPSDCTFNQHRGREKMLQWSREGTSYSLDLTSATDRFPITLQEKILGVILGSPELAVLWRKIMVDRDYVYKGKPYRWNTGQPLGSYSSWPIFAISHHCVVLYSAVLVGEKNPQYFLLGDDIVINGKAHAQSYKEVMSRLGCQFSDAKGMSGYSIEFAKRIFHKGTEVSPIPVNMVTALLKDPVLIHDTVYQLVQRSSYLERRELRVNRFLESASELTNYSLHKLEILTYSPFGDRRFDPHPIDGCGNQVWPVLEGSRKTETIQKIVAYDYVTRQYNNQQEVEEAVKAALPNVDLPGFTSSGNFRQLHPALTSHQKLMEDSFEKSYKALGKYWTATGQKAISEIPLPQISSISVESLTADHTERVKHKAKVTFETFFRCIALKEKEEGKSCFLSKWIRPELDRIAKEDANRGRL